LIQLFLKDVLYLIKHKTCMGQSFIRNSQQLLGNTGLSKGVHRDQQEVHAIQDLQITMEDLPTTATGVHVAEEEFLEVDAEEPVFSEMFT
jgi:hypothetical protein